MTDQHQEGAAAEQAAAPPPPVDTAAVPAVAGADVQTLMALTALQHGLATAVDQERARVVAAGRQVWEQTKVATTFRHPLGTASLRQNHPKILVVDEDAWLGYVLEHAETEVEVITRVRPAYTTAVLGRLKIVGGQILDPETGAVVEIPGVSIVPGGPPNSIGVTLTGDAKETAEAMVRARLDQLAGYALPAGDTEGQE